ncbi:MAG: electron transport complex subunit RsxC [Acutalibacteraceae bacterium]|nr:electron transport complex subunit RsxC [Clostridia bacterium]MEE0981885.1 electron transport complex subunit RsxC [Acutalibacteraceae bacterium]
MGKIHVPGVIKAVKKVRGGVKVAHHKNTAELEVVRMPEPKQVILPMQQHIGAPCTPTVKVGDTVAVGQVIGDSDKPVSAPIHASVSGTVTAIGNVKLPGGAMAQGVTIESDGEMRLYEGIKPPHVETKEDFIKAIRESGLVGLGGAGFPTHIKLNAPAKIDTLIINAAECEPYITVDYRECIENSWDIYSGIRTIMEFLEIPNVVIAVEDNKPEAFKILEQIVDGDSSANGAIKIMQLESRYPQGAEKMMIQSATGRQLPPGKLPSDIGCMVMNVASTAFISRYLKTGKPLVSRSLTVDGMAIKEPKNLRVPIGTSISDIIEFCGGFKDEPVKIVAGGPMMGTAITDLDHPLSKSNNALLAFSKEDAKVFKETDCIRCGRCASACPISLVPTRIVRNAKAKDADALVKDGVMVCMECGSCAYSCPAKKPLVQHMRLAKAIVREAGAK